MFEPRNAPDGYRVHWALVTPAPLDSRQRNRQLSESSAVAPTAVAIAVQAARPDGGYMSFGFSPDGKMVGSKAVIGWLGSGSSESSVELYDLTSRTVSGVVPLPNTLIGEPASISSVDGDLVEMRFTLPLSVSGLASDSPVFTIFSLGSTAGLSTHSWRGFEQVVLNGGAGARAGLILDISYAKLAHALCMLLGWGILIPSGTAIAAGLRKGIGDPLWFKLHRYTQVLGLFVAIAGFIIALTRFTWGLTSQSEAHAILGTVVMALGLLQPLNGILRPKKGAPSRVSWELLHKGSGYLAILLAVPTIAMGIQLFDTQESLNFPGATLGMSIVQGAVLLLLLAIVAYGYCVQKRSFLSAPQAASALKPMSTCTASASSGGAPTVTVGIEATDSKSGSASAVTYS